MGQKGNGGGIQASNCQRSSAEQQASFRNNVGIAQRFVEPGNGLDCLSRLLPASQTPAAWPVRASLNKVGLRFGTCPCSSSSALCPLPGVCHLLGGDKRWEQSVSRVAIVCAKTVVWGPSQTEPIRLFEKKLCRAFPLHLRKFSSMASSDFRAFNLLPIANWYLARNLTCA